MNKSERSPQVKDMAPKMMIDISNLDKITDFATRIDLGETPSVSKLLNNTIAIPVVSLLREHLGKVTPIIQTPQVLQPSEYTPGGPLDSDSHSGYFPPTASNTTMNIVEGMGSREYDEDSGEGNGDLHNWSPPPAPRLKPKTTIATTPLSMRNTYRADAPVLTLHVRQQ